MAVFTTFRVVDSKAVKKGDHVYFTPLDIREVKGSVVDPDDGTVMVFFGDSSFTGFPEGVEATIAYDDPTIL